MKWRLSSLQFDLFLLISEQWQPPFHTHHSSKQKSAKYITDFQFFTTLHWTVLSFCRVGEVRIKSHVKMSWFYSSSGNFGAPDGPSENPSCSQAESKAHNDWSRFGLNNKPVSCARRGWSVWGGRAGESRACTRACEFTCCQRCFKQRWRR